MNKRQNIVFNGKRGLTAHQGAAYKGLGTPTFKKWADEIGAVRRFGRSVRYDRVIIDKILDGKEAKVK